MADEEKVKIEIKKLKHKRSGIKLQLNSLKRFLERLDLDITVELASELDNDENLLAVENDRCEFENSYFDIKYKLEKGQNHFVALAKTKNGELKDLIDEENLLSKSNKPIEIGSESEISDDSQATEITHKSKILVKKESKSVFKSIRLPQITLPRFDGRLDKWLRFRDSFTAMIINNTELTDVERFYYLEGNVDGEAKKTIEVVEFSDEGFKNAWEALIFKYDNTRSIIEKHMNAFFNMKTLIKESATDIRKLLDDSLIHMRALESLGERVTDVVAVHTVKQRLDYETRKLWENENRSDTPLTWAQLVEFLQRRCQILQALNDINIKSHTLVPYNNRKTLSKSFVTATVPNKSLYCALCKQSHFIAACGQFVKMTVQERYEKVRQLGLCLNCLKGRHKVIDCRGPLCNHCHRKHSSFLHMGNLSQTSSSPNSKATGSGSNAVGQDISLNKQKDAGNNGDKCYTNLCCQMQNVKKNQVVLSTAIIFIKDSNGRYHLCRALLDSASQSNFATEKLADRLRIKKEQLSHLVSGLNQAKTNIQYKFSSNIKSRLSSYQTELEFLVIPEIANNLPSNFINVASWDLPKNLELADPSFNQPKEIDLLLGAEIFFRILNNGRVDLAQNLPCLQNTTFGWIVSGKMECKNFFVSEVADSSFCNFDSLAEHIPSNSELDKNLTRFWEFENFDSNASKLSLEEKKCEDIFRKSYTRDKDGRFVVTLPFKENASELGGLGGIALKRFMYLESKLNRNTEWKNSIPHF